MVTVESVVFSSSVVPNYAGDVFIIRDFSKLSDAGEPVFSESVFSGGLKWRIKVYPVRDRSLMYLRCVCALEYFVNEFVLLL